MVSNEQSIYIRKLHPYNTVRQDKFVKQANYRISQEMRERPKNLRFLPLWYCVNIIRVKTNLKKTKYYVGT